jgi:hypothetical protein
MRARIPAATPGTIGLARDAADERQAVDQHRSVFDNNVAGGSPGALNPAGLPTTSNNVFFNNTAGGTPDDQTATTRQLHRRDLRPAGTARRQRRADADHGAGVRRGGHLRGRRRAAAGRHHEGSARLSTRGSPNCLDAGSVQHEVIPVPVLSPPVLALLASLLLVMFGIYRLRSAAG